MILSDSSQTCHRYTYHNGNIKPCIPIDHSVHLTETYDNMKILLETRQYSTYQWNICGDLKVIDMLMGMQGGFTKYCCFLCLWDSRATGHHYIKREWQKRTKYEPGMNSVQNVPLVDPKKIFQLPLHIKLGLMKKIVKAMGKTNSRRYQYLVTKFPKITAVNLKEAIL